MKNSEAELKIAMKRVMKRSKKRDENNENDPFKSIPLDLKVEILMKLPPRSIAILRFTSKHLSSIITSKEFTDLYMTRSSTQPRYLFSVYGRGDKKMQLFHSSSQEDQSASDRVSHTLDPDLPYIFTPPIRGLICGRYDNEIMIGNPSTGQFVSLPRFKTRRKNILSVLGYDPVNDLYKVLSITVITTRDICRDAMWEEHQVITVGAKQKWRIIECKYPHRYYCGYVEGICRDGVVYYLASSYEQDERVLMSFHLSTEEFNVTKLPKDLYLQQHVNLVNHTGKITIWTREYYGPSDLWVLEDASKEVWSKAAAVVPCVADICGMDQIFVFQGILGTGEIIFAPPPFPPANPLFFLCYDPKENNARKVVIEEIGDGSAAIKIFFDHVESYLFL